MVEVLGRAGVSSGERVLWKSSFKNGLTEDLLRAALLQCSQARELPVVCGM